MGQARTQSDLLTRILNTDQSGAYGPKSVTTSATLIAVGSSNLANRTTMVAVPTNGDIYWGYDDQVTTSTGIPITSGNTGTWHVGDNVNIYAIAAGTVNVRIAEAL